MAAALSVRLRSLACDYLELTATEGAGESLSRIPVRAGDYLLADRGYSTAAGLGRVDAADEPFDLLAAVRTVRRYGQTRSWDVRVIDPRSRPVPGLRAPQVRRGDSHRASRLAPGRLPARGAPCSRRHRNSPSA